MSVLVLADHDNSEIRSATLNAITAARQIGEVTVLVAGAGCDGVATTLSNVNDVTRVILVDDPGLEHHLAESLAPLIVELSDGFSHIFAPSTAMGKNVIPRVAGSLDVAQISDVSEILDGETFVRSIYAGNALATVRSNDSIKVATVRSTAFSEATQDGGAGEVVKHDYRGENSTSRYVGAELSESERPELASAKIVVSGGRGMGSEENFALVEKLADKLGAAVGASRAAVDAGFASNDLQVGQTGKIVAPELYIAVGISGAIQHLAGMKDSRVIVAINKDEEAPIFQVADYGLVTDLFDALPELDQKL